MPRAVLGFGPVLANEIVRHMAVVAYRHSMMRGFLPTVVLFAHDVAVHARLRIVGQIRQALGFYEREPARAHENADEHREHDSCHGEHPSALADGRRHIAHGTAPCSCEQATLYIRAGILKPCSINDQSSTT